MNQNAKPQNIRRAGMKINYTKWGLIVAIVGVLVTVATVPEFRRFTDLD